MCVPDVGVSTTKGMDTLQGYPWMKAKVTFNGCNIGVRAYIHCNDFPFGTSYWYGPTVTAVGATSNISCTGSFMSGGYEYRNGSSWYRVQTHP